MWLENSWYAVAFADAVKDEPIAVTALDQKLVLFRGESGEITALADRCPHRGVPLSYGKVLGNDLRCGYHGLRINSEGVCVKIPCQTQIPSQARVRRYPLEVKYKLVWVWMGKAELADPSKIPDFHYMDDPEWVTCTGYHHVKANYQLLNDNLLDLSHESYVHDTTIGNDAVAEAPASMTRSDNEVRVHRDILNAEPPAFYIKATGFTENINRWHTTIFTPPGNHVIENGSYPATGSRDQALERRVMHVLTPATETTTHYFWGVSRQYARDDAELTEYIRQQIAETFDQDAEILELQQSSIGAEGSAFPIALVTDAGPVQARRMLSQLIAREAAQA
ncbi:MAG: aromatic ring-hydroxylating dioxygenase subunit alpha [Pseudomonadota bacterium]